MAELQPRQKLSQFAGAKTLLQPAVDGGMKFLGAPLGTGKFREKFIPKEGRKNRPLIVLKRERRGSPVRHGALEFRQGWDQILIERHRVGDRFHQSLKADVDRDRGVIEAHRFRDSVAGRGHRGRSRQGLPCFPAIKTNLDRVIFPSRFDRHIPVPCFERHSNLLLNRADFILQTQVARAAGVTRDFNIPVSEKPARILRGEENGIRPVAVRERSQFIDVHLVHRTLKAPALGRFFFKEGRGLGFGNGLY